MEKYENKIDIKKLEDDLINVDYIPTKQIMVVSHA